MRPSSSAAVPATKGAPLRNSPPQGFTAPRLSRAQFAERLRSAVAAALGYALLGDASAAAVAVVQAFAAGAILTMLADTMMPEAFEHAGKVVGLLTTLGFAASFAMQSF